MGDVLAILRRKDRTSQESKTVNSKEVEIPSKILPTTATLKFRTSFVKLVEEMVESDISVLEKGGAGLNEQVPDAFTPGVSPQ